MTTFSYTLFLDDSQCDALEAALELLLQQCEDEIRRHPRAPYYAWKDSVTAIKSRLLLDRKEIPDVDVDPTSGISSLTNSYTIVLCDSESIALGAALELLLDKCKREYENGSGEPYETWLWAALSIRRKRYCHVQQTSGSYIDPKTGEYTIWIAGLGDGKVDE